MEISSSTAAEPGRLRWIAHPVLLLVVAFLVFSFGMWKARVGFGDDTVPTLQALSAAETRTFPTNAYHLAYTLLLRFATPDPIYAALVMRAAVSLFTTLALYYVLSAFRPHLHRAAILLACAVWMVTHLNAPLVQYSNLSPFTYGIAALGLGWLLRRRSWLGLAGFGIAVGVASTLRPEYFAPALLIGTVAGLDLLRKTCASRQVSPVWFWSAIAVGVAAAALLVTPRFRPGGGLDRYLLFGLGQCYAAFYQIEHPEVPFHAMTEYQSLQDATFGNAGGFFEAVANNPHEAFRYFALNSLANLRLLIPSLLSTRHTLKAASLLDPSRIHALVLLVLLAAGGALLIQRAWRAARPGGRGPSRAPLLWKVLLVALFCSASSVAFVLLVPSPRYWISCVPLLFLLVAACFDAVLRLRVLAGREWLLWAPLLVLFCRPLFLGLGPNENFEVNALRHLAPKLPREPIIAGVYTRPYQAYAFRGHAVSINASNGLSAADVRAGRYDVLIVDAALRTSRIWYDDRSFFEAFEADPAARGYVKLNEVFTGRRDIYYRPHGL